MWPDDCIDWARRSKEETVKRLRAFLQKFFARHVVLREEVDTLAGAAAKAVFDSAAEHSSDTGYFEAESQFVRWLTVLSFRELLRIVLSHSALQSPLEELLLKHRRILGMIYKDRLPPGDVGPILGMSSEEVRRQEKGALQALLQELRRNPEA